MLVITDHDSHGDVAMVEVPGGKTADARHAATVRDGVLETPARRSDLPEEAQSVQEIRLARCVGADHEHPLLQIEVRLFEVPPVFQRQVSQSHGY